jgi:hypothetical protein
MQDDEMEFRGRAGDGGLRRTNLLFDHSTQNIRPRFEANGA